MNQKHKKDRFILGIDLGSLNTKVLLLDESLQVIRKTVIQKNQELSREILSLVKDPLKNLKSASLLIGITGGGRESIHPDSRVFLCNDVIALALGSSSLYPCARTIIEIGSHSSKWIQLGDRTGSNEPEIIDFALNERCAAGSGSFIEQQASRLKISLDKLSGLAASSEHGAVIAGRCSVFAKSDMIHLQQKGTPEKEILYGLCLALARNYVATILRGRDCLPPVLLTGGAFQNKGLIRAFKEAMKLEDEEVILSDSPFFTCAYGAALGAEKFGERLSMDEIIFILHTFRLKEKGRSAGLSPLGQTSLKRNEEPSLIRSSNQTGYLGVDVGSVSTNLAFIDTSGDVKSGIYLPTRGKPLDVIKEGLETLFRQSKKPLEILGIGATGSGRYLAGKFLEADTVTNEITCQLAGTIRFFPEVDTIFEIGGQDSKFISVRKSRIHDFTMNKICAAGTGSFLEEQAEQLGIQIKDEFSRLAGQSFSPYDLGAQCTVFMETELASAISKRVPIPDITAGLAYSIARNYLEKVVGDRPVGQNIVFQGGVASNPSVIKAFVLLLDRTIHLHPYNRISGAIGAAFLAQEAVEQSVKISPGYAKLKKKIGLPYSISSFTCKNCPNQCQVNRITFNKEKIFFGDTCERYTAGQESNRKKERQPLDLLEKRKDLFNAYIPRHFKEKKKIGLPRASFMHEYLPFWATFFHALGFDVEVSPGSNPALFEKGIKKLSAETCLPVKLAYGHIQYLSEQNVEWIFFPSHIDLAKTHEDSMRLCPYSENLPFMVRPAAGKNYLSPSVCPNAGPSEFLRAMAETGEMLSRTQQDLKNAYNKASTAQKEFIEKRKAAGEEVILKLNTIKTPLWLILGKPYNLYDPFLNLNLGHHLKRLGISFLPIDLIPPSAFESLDWPEVPPWYYNRQMIKGALWSLERKNIYPVIISNFGCGPDAFAMKHLSKILEEKLYLSLEFDEHRGEAGLITRLEAFKDEVTEASSKDSKPVFSAGYQAYKEKLPIEEYKKRKFIIPYFGDHAIAFSGSFQAVGIETEIMPFPDKETIRLGEQACSGKECHAYSLIAGDLVKASRSKRKGGEVFFFPGSKHTCLLIQYGPGMKYLLDDLGVSDIHVLSPSVGFYTKLLGYSGTNLLWQGLVAVDYLIKASCEKRPYEIQKGQTERIHKENLKDIETGLSQENLSPALKRCTDRLRQIKIKHEQRPLIGIAGDIYTRQQPVANHDLFLKLEKLGCEVWPAPFLVDNFDFGIRKIMLQKARSRKYHETAIAALFYLRKEIESWKVRKNLKGASSRHSEPSFKEILEFSSPYIGWENNETLLLNIAKMVDFAKHGADGVINAICFNCMLGTISEAIAAQIRKDFRKIPIPTLIFSGAETNAEKTKLEAFVYQVRHRATAKTRQ